MGVYDMLDELQRKAKKDAFLRKTSCWIQDRQNSRFLNSAAFAGN